MKKLIAAYGLMLMACAADAPNSPSDGPPPPPPPPTDGPAPDPIARGKYLVENVSGCVGCHTPRLATGALDQTKFLAGVQCFIDTAPADNNAGCLHTGNLTNHATGLATRSDAEIINMFQNGMRPDGTAMFANMPYWVYHNRTASDAMAVVKYLRSVPGVDRTLPANQPPFATRPASPAVPLADADIPKPTTANASTSNGRYLVAMAGRCILCHTPLTNAQNQRSLDLTKVLAGGRSFPGAPPLPAMVYATNLTPHPTGLNGYTAEQIKAVLKTGLDKDNKRVCRPMPGGPMSEYGGLSDSDALDIGTYLTSLTPVANAIPNECSVAP